MLRPYKGEDASSRPGPDMVGIFDRDEFRFAPRGMEEHRLKPVLPRGKLFESAGDEEF
jgi:hypothetical protein